MAVLAFWMRSDVLNNFKCVVKMERILIISVGKLFIVKPTYLYILLFRPTKEYQTQLLDILSSVRNTLDNKIFNEYCSICVGDFNSELQ